MRMIPILTPLYSRMFPPMNQALAAAAADTRMCEFRFAKRSQPIL